MYKLNFFKKTLLTIGLFCLILISCGASNVERKTVGGIGLGALAGGLITGNVSGLVTGAAVGGVTGYVIGTDQDRHKESVALEKEKQAIERERNQLAKAKITADPSTAHRPDSRNDLVGTTWRVISIEGDQPYPSYHSLVVTFSTNNILSTLVIQKDGSAESVTESYQVVDDVMVISGSENEKKYVVSGKYSMLDNQLVYVTPTYRVVTERIE